MSATPPPSLVHALITSKRGLFAPQHTTLEAAVSAAGASDPDDGAVTHVAAYQLVEVIEIAEAKRRASI